MPQLQEESAFRRRRHPLKTHASVAFGAACVVALLATPKTAIEARPSASVASACPTYPDPVGGGTEAPPFAKLDITNSSIVTAEAIKCWTENLGLDGSGIRVTSSLLDGKLGGVQAEVNIGKLSSSAFADDAGRIIGVLKVTGSQPDAGVYDKLSYVWVDKRANSNWRFVIIGSTTDKRVVLNASQDAQPACTKRDPPDELGCWARGTLNGISFNRVVFFFARDIGPLLSEAASAR